MVQWSLANAFGENYPMNISDVTVLAIFGGLTTVFVLKLIKKMGKETGETAHVEYYKKEV